MESQKTNFIMYNLTEVSVNECQTTTGRDFLKSSKNMTRRPKSLQQILDSFYRKIDSHIEHLEDLKEEYEETIKNNPDEQMVRVCKIAVKSINQQLVKVKRILITFNYNNMKIISKNEEKNTITIEVDEEFVDDLMDCVRQINTRLCEEYNLKYQRNLFTNFDELVVELLRWEITYGREDSINKIIENKKDWWEEYINNR